MNPFDARQSRIGKVGRKAEKKTAVRLIARLTPASGAAMSKGDFTTPDMLIENKVTENATLALKYEWLVKITEEAAFVGKTPALAFSFVDGTGRPFRHGSWVALPESEFAAYQAYLKSQNCN